MTTAPNDVVIVGGGVIGCSIAWHLASRGAGVTLLEQNALASAASGASAGGVRQQGRDLRELPLAICAIGRWEHLEAELDADLHYHREGHLTLIEDETDLPAVELSVAQQRAAGLDLHTVVGDDLRDLAPGIADHVTAGTYSEHDGHANPILTTHAFARAAEQAGARIRTGTTVTGIHQQGGRVIGVDTSAGPVSCDHLVLAAGLWIPRLVSGIGINLPIVGFAPQMLATRPMEPRLHQVLGARSRKLSLKQIPTGNYVIGGGWPGDIDLAAGVATPREESIVGSIRDATAVFPELANATLERVWVGVEALTIDEVPILGPLPGVDNLTVAAGFSGHGFALGPIVGQLIAEQILDGTSSLSIDALGLDRFAGAQSGPPKITPKAG
ncbi:MAG TPA: FAD-binding oxidoreductase [Thermomicrobiales bacterium]|nr:FAD-binding oxidoreductase [Thermomicrobiales bacterium]